MASQEDPLRQIAESLANLERLYADSLRRQEEQIKRSEDRQKVFDESQKIFDERQKRWAKIDEELEKHGLFTQNPRLHLSRIGHFLIVASLLILAFTVFIMARR